MDRVRILRVLEYEGDRDWVESSLAARSVKGVIEVSGAGQHYSRGIIREAIIGETPVILESKEEE